MARFKDVDWNLEPTSNGGAKTWEQVLVAGLMDIRDELKDINRSTFQTNAVAHCSNALAIPGMLRKIAANTAKKRRKKVTKGDK